MPHPVSISDVGAGQLCTLPLCSLPITKHGVGHVAMVVLESTAAPLLQLWREGVLSDVQITSADGHKFACHRIILAAASAYFRAQLAGPWSEGGDTAAATIRVQLHMPAAVLQRVLDGLYSNELHLPETPEGLLEVLI